MKSRSTSNSDNLIEILRFWHRLEFFTPFDLSKRTEKSDKKKVFWLDRDDIEDQLSALTAFRPVEGKRIASAHLFAGVFPISELERFARELAPEAVKTIDDEERGLTDGRSCFARFGLDVEGAFRVNFADIDISTLPWAIGQSRKSGLKVLKDSNYLDSLLRLTDRFRQISDRATDHSGAALSPETLLDLIRTLETWADFDLSTSGHPIACVEINLVDAKRSSATAPAQASPEDNDEDQEEEEAVADAEIGILNSFYISDIEHAMTSLEESGEMGALRAYLSATMGGEAVDLYGPEGHQTILGGVKPRQSNRGRWMSPPEHAMSLMQQFAINKAIGLRGSSGIFSVNGPPGTGKTTLLRDVIADNIVARAEVLSRFKKASDAFESRRLAEKGGSSQKTGTLSILKPELRGFGMVVASSNNAAVENISRDLPKSSSIEAPPDFGYLQPVAHKLAAQKPDGSFANLSDEDRPWGLIAAALGKKSNRYTFRQRVFFPSAPAKDKRNQHKNPGPVAPLNIWDWRKAYNGPGFLEAAAEFRKQSDRVTAETALAERFATLAARLSGQTAESYVTPYQIRLDDAQEQSKRSASELDLARQAVGTLQRKRDDLREDERLLDRQRPAWWARLLGTQEAHAHHRKVAANAAKQQDTRDEFDRAVQHAETRCLRNAKETDLALQKASGELTRARAEFDAQKTEFRSLREQGFSLPDTALSDLNSDDVQISGLWHHARVAEARSSLTRAALRLHEAWLAEVSQPNGGFGSNLMAISNFLNGEYDGDPGPVWESMFMMVPLVSTTFASFARQFSGMSPGSLGWLFIDEAGQAVPQAAVGAIMRSRSVVVIGDPLQIEPVFTLPTALIDALAGLANVTADGSRSPNRVSVQVLADQTNCFGAQIPMDDDEDIWIGSPLRVHRRCADPMFGLANDIAYRGKMVFGASRRIPAEDVSPYLGESAWIDLSGRVVGKQTVPAQVHFMTELVQIVCRTQRKLPDLYVISPFKEVAVQLREQLMQADWTKVGISQTSLRAWVTQNVGTVHTFQGKEEEVVFMVLGADGDHAPAARWASSKPNLLNVALTRAKKRFYAVGDRELWSQMAGFDIVARTLPVMSPDEALRRARSTAASAASGDVDCSDPSASSSHEPELLSRKSPASKSTR